MIKWTWFKENGIETKRDFLVALRMALPIEMAWFFLAVATVFLVKLFVAFAPNST